MQLSEANHLLHVAAYVPLSPLHFSRFTTPRRPVGRQCIQLQKCCFLRAARVRIFWGDALISEGISKALVMNEHA
ncbi:hypothetical protein ACU8KH_02871 [Lachancea thermotolerans]